MLFAEATIRTFLKKKKKEKKRLIRPVFRVVAHCPKRNSFVFQRQKKKQGNSFIKLFLKFCGAEEQKVRFDNFSPQTT